MLRINIIVLYQKYQIKSYYFVVFQREQLSPAFIKALKIQHNFFCRQMSSIAAQVLVQLPEPIIWAILHYLNDDFLFDLRNELADSDRFADIFIRYYNYRITILGGGFID